MSAEPPDNSVSPSGTGSAERVGKRKGRRKLAIFFAMGLVLGLLVMGTLAVYSDSEYGKSEFESGHWGLPGWFFPWGGFEDEEWNVQGNFTVDRADSGWASFETIPQSGEFRFTVEPQNMYPGKTVFAPVSLRVDPEQDQYAARISLAGGGVPEPNYLYSALRYTVGDANAADCVAGNLGTPRPGFPGSGGEPEALFVPSDPLQPVVLPRNSEPVDFCFAVTLPESFANDVAVRGQSTGAVQWNFVASADL